MTRLPRLLNSSLQEVSRLHPVSLNISEKLIPLSFASMYLLKDEMVTERQWIELYTPVGSAGIYRTRSPQTGIGSESYMVELDHGIVELGDYIIPDTIDKEMTCREAIKTFFTHYRGNRWKLGSVACTAKVVVDVDYDNLLESINGVLDQVPDYVMSFNFNTSPWTLNIVHKETVVTAEGRLSRNVKTATIKSDDKDLCTRVYVKGLKEEDKFAFVNADTRSKYGLIEHVETGTGYTKEQAQLVADHYLAAHKNPKVSVEISAIELSQITGEELDKFKAGKLFRLAIPDRNLIIEDVITTVSWGDVYGNPMDATVSLGDDRDSVLSFWQDQKKSGKSTQKQGTKTYKTSKEAKTHIEQTDKYVELYAAKTDLNNNILEQAGLYLDSHGILMYADDKVNGISSKIKQTADEIRSEVSSTAEGLQTQITQNATSISLKVSKGDVSTELSVEMGNVTVRNGNLVVEGMVTADAVKTAFAAIQTVTANTINAGALNVAVGQNWVPVATQTYVSGTVYSFSLIDNGGGSYTMQWKELGEEGAQWHTANFSRAVSLSGAWNGATHTYTATAGSSSVSTTVLLDYTSGTTNFAVHLCHDSTAQANRLVSKSFFLVQDVDSKTVTCRADSSTGTVYGTISTAATYNSVTVDAVEFDTSTGSIITDDSERTNVYIRGVASNNAKKSRLFRLVAPTATVDGHYVVNLQQGSDIIGRIYADTAYNAVTVDTVSRSGATVTATASNGNTGTLTMSSYSNAVSSLTYITSATSSPTTTPTTMYAYVNGTLTSMGSGYWYKRDGYMAPTTLYK